VLTYLTLSGSGIGSTGVCKGQTELLIKSLNKS
jgi:hypothetical protein